MHYAGLLKNKALKATGFDQIGPNINFAKGFMLESKSCQLKEKALRFNNSWI